MNKRQKKKKIKNRNKRLCERYPFLIPRNVFTGKILNHFNYTWTELDAMENGWKKAFGLLMCEEIREELIKYNYLNKYRITQIKEKYASLRWYDAGAPGNVHEIIRKYEYISGHVCQVCGKLDTPMLVGGWMMVICENCYEKNRKIYTWWKPYENETKSENVLKNSYTFSRYSKQDGEWFEVEVDISDTIEKIRSGYRVKI